jgi:small subunit ribosomal protein S18
MRPREGAARKIKKRSASFGLMRKRVCRFCKEKITTVDYKDIKRLERFLTERGKILSSRISGNCAKHQRIVSAAMRRARFVSLLPYTKV